MFNDISMQLFGYIMDAEMIILDLYKVDPWEIMRHMPMVDLQIYLKRIEEDQKRKKDRLKKKDVMEALKNINDVLTWIFHQK